MKRKRLIKGQALVEFALIVVLFLLFVLAFFDFGRMVLDYSLLNTCVREGTRMAVVGAGETEINARINQICGSLDGFDVGDITYYSYVSGGPEDQKIRITIDYEYPPFTPGMELLLGKIPLQAQAETYLAPFYTQ
jgi:hypothetical protein